MGTQSEVDLIKYNKMLRNHEIVTNHKRLNTNKLQGYVERIKYGISKNKPISLKSLLNFIPDLYNEKIASDTKAEIEGTSKFYFDEFLFNFLKEKFK